MSIDESQIGALRDLCDEISILTEGPHTFVFLKCLRFLCGGNPLKVDALLCPQEHSSYATRLFLEQKHSYPLSDGNEPNWQVHSILGKPWHTWSWKDVSADQTLLEILSGHLDAFK